MAPVDRKKIMVRFSELMAGAREELALLESLDVGKPITNAFNGDIPSAIGCIQWYGEAIDKLYGEVAPTRPISPPSCIASRSAWLPPWCRGTTHCRWRRGSSGLLLHQGTRWCSSPPSSRRSPPSASRNSASKPAAEGRAQRDPGFGETAGRALGLHMDVDAVGFTGSTAVGKLFMQYSGQSNIKRIGLECGGKSPHIVMADCHDLDAAARAVAPASSRTPARSATPARGSSSRHRSARRCSRRLSRSHATSFRGAARPRHQAGRDRQSTPDGKRARLRRDRPQGRRSGAGGGNRAREASGGFFVAPTVFDGVDNRMRIAQEEIFGPVLAAVTVSGLDEAIKVATIRSTASVRHLDKRHPQGAGRLQGTAGRCRLGQLLRPRQHVGAVRRLQAVRLRRDKSMHAFDKYMDWKAVWTAA
jgi:gamma-glutamyl-gamma-aminobutyraldehyde dehydrogenase